MDKCCTPTIPVNLLQPWEDWQEAPSDELMGCGSAYMHAKPLTLGLGRLHEWVWAVGSYYFVCGLEMSWGLLPYFNHPRVPLARHLLALTALWCNHASMRLCCVFTCAEVVGCGHPAWGECMLVLSGCHWVSCVANTYATCVALALLLALGRC